MVTLYWIGFIGGGIFVILAVFGGLDGVEFDLDADPDLELLDLETRLEQKRSPLSPKRRSRWLGDILTSFKFWTFGSCFFGLTGLLLTQFSDVSRGSILAIALGLGLLLGTTMASILINLRRNHANSLVRNEDLVGMTGIVEIPFDANRRGKVRLQLKGSTIDYIAYTNDTQALVQGAKVIVVGQENHHLWVVPQETILPPSPSES